MKKKYYFLSLPLATLLTTISDPNFIQANTKDSQAGEIHRATLISKEVQKNSEQTNSPRRETDSSRSRENSNKKPQRNIEYQPPVSAEKIRQATRAGGSRTRGCEQKLEVKKLYLIAPQDRVAFTSQKRPTFYLYLDRVPSQNLRYSLNSNKKLVFQTTITIAQKGIVPITLPENIALEPSGEYFLTIGLICDRNIPIKDFHVSVKFVKIHDNSNLELPLSLNNLWYDLLDFAYKSDNKALFLSLADRIGFDDIEFSK